MFHIAWRESTSTYRKALKTARSAYFLSLLEENKHNPRYLFNAVTKLMKNKASTGADISPKHSSNDFMNFFTSKIDNIREKIITMQLSATVLHQCTVVTLRNNSIHALLSTFLDVLASGLIRIQLFLAVQNSLFCCLILKIVVSYHIILMYYLNYEHTGL